jgi:hypothetical protein
MNAFRQKSCFVFLFACVIAIVPLRAQTKWYNGLAIETGAGYNTMSIATANHYFNTDTSYSRTTFGIQPAIRLSYEFALSQKDSTRFFLAPFIGYYIFGGKSRTEANGYKDVYKFNSLEAGIIPSMRVYKGLYAGIGIKGQYIFSVRQKYYGILNQPDSVPRTWETRDQSDIYYLYAGNAGVQLKYRVKHITIAAEGWFGLSNLFSLKSDLVDVRTTENNYRIMIGYSF